MSRLYIGLIIVLTCSVTTEDILYQDNSGENCLQIDFTGVLVSIEGNSLDISVVDH